MFDRETDANVAGGVDAAFDWATWSLIMWLRIIF
jgi:hypothetical protein